MDTIELIMYRSTGLFREKLVLAKVDSCELTIEWQPLSSDMQSVNDDDNIDNLLPAYDYIPPAIFPLVPIILLAIIFSVLEYYK